MFDLKIIVSYKLYFFIWYKLRKQKMIFRYMWNEKRLLSWKPTRLEIINTAYNTFQ